MLPPPAGTANSDPGFTQNIPTPQTIKPIPNVRPIMMRVPGWSLTLPIVPGTECFLLFADMCVDGWWQNGGVQTQYDRRRHDLSDAFALFGPWSQPNTLDDYSTDSMQLRSDDGTVVIDLAVGKITVKAPEIDLKNSVGTPKALMNDTFFQWYVTNIQPFLDGLGYSGPAIPVGSETTVVKAV